MTIIELALARFSEIRVRILNTRRCQLLIRGGQPDYVPKKLVKWPKIGVSDPVIGLFAQG